jgi:hypothetical protein
MYMGVFLKRFTELRDKDIILKKLSQRRLEAKHL